MSKKIKFLLIIVLVAAIAIGALFLYQWLEKEKQLAALKESFRQCQNLENINITANPEGPPTDISGLDSPIEHVIYGGESVDCLSMYDIYFCNLIDNEEKKLFCEETFYAFKAIKENNLDYCEKTGERKLLCQAMLKKDESLCEKGELEANSSSISEFRACRAVVKEDVKECENLVSEIEIQKCKINYYITLALLKKDISLCDKIEGKKRKALLNCKAALDINECFKYHTEVQCPEIYLPQIAAISKDPSVCEDILYKDEDAKGRFLYQVCVKNAK